MDILVNNVGILRDKTFAKMDLADFELVLKVHLMGAVHCTRAVWPIMKPPNRTILCAGAGSFEAAHITMTQGIWLGTDEQTPERLAEQLTEVTDRADERVPPNGSEQGSHEVAKAMIHATQAAGRSGTR